MSEVVTVNTTGGSPTLTLNDGGTATYTGGSGTNALTFSYTVLAGQNTPDLMVSAVNLNGATLLDGAGNAANVSLTGVSQGSPQIDTLAPTVTAVTDNVAAAVTKGPISFTATFSEAVTGVSTSSFTATNGTVASVTQVDASHYTVVVNPTAGIASGDVALSLVAGGATDTAGNAAVAASLSSLDSQGIDTLAPAAPVLALGTGVANGVTAAEATAAGGVVTVTGEAGDSISVTFTNGTHVVTKTLTGTGSAQAVTLTAGDLTTLTNGTIGVSATQTDAAGNVQTAAAATTSFVLDTVAPAAPTLALGTGVADGATAAEATAAGGVVTVTGEAGDSISVTFTNGTHVVTKTLTGTGSAQAVKLTAGDLATLTNGTIGVSAEQTDAAGNVQTAAAATTSFVLDTVAPAAPTLALGTGVANGATAAEATAAGGVVTVTGEAGDSISVTFTNGTHVVTKTLTGTGSAQAVTLTAGDLTTLTNGTIGVSATQTDAAGNVQTAAAATTSFVLDTTAPTLSSVTETPSNGHLKVGKSVTVTLNLSEAVTVAGGTPTLALSSGGTATYTGGSGTNALTFSYTVAAGQNTASLKATAISLNGATITDSAGNAASLFTLSGVAQAGAQIDTTAPSVTQVIASPGSGIELPGNTVALTLNLTEAVTVTGTPTLTLNDGGTATYVSGTGTNALTFNYTVGATDSAVAALAITQVSLLAGATVMDAAGNAADLSGAVTTFPGLAIATVIEALGSTSLVQTGSNYYLDSNSTGTGPELKYQGSPVVTGEFTAAGGGTWTLIGAEQTASGYEVAWKVAGVDKYTVWNVDSNGNYISNPIMPTSGSSLALENIETSFHQDLNGDAVIGIPSATVIESFGSTNLVQAGSNYFLDSNSTGSGPELKFIGTPVVTGEFTAAGGGTWTLIGAEQTASGYEVAWKVAGVDKYTVWNVDSSGNYVSNSVMPTSGSSLAMEIVETSFHQDLNGDGVIGVPAGTSTAIEAFGSTTLLQTGSNYFLDSNSTGSGPELKYQGSPVVTGEFTAAGGGTWTLIGAEQTASGYEVAWKVAGVDKYTVWNVDSSGNYISNSVMPTSGSSLALENIETSFHQDLNGDGVVFTSGSGNAVGAGGLVIGAGATVELTGAYSGAITFAGATGTLKIDNTASFTGQIGGQLAIGDVIDFAGITAGANATIGYSGNNSPGTLTVSDGTHTASIALLGNYSLANFTASSDGHGGTSVVDPPIPGQTGDVAAEIMNDPGFSALNQQLALFSQHMASAFPTSAFGSDGASIVTPPELGAAPLSQIAQPIANQQHA